jgi:hypothetical protein
MTCRSLSAQRNRDRAVLGNLKGAGLQYIGKSRSKILEGALAVLQVYVNENGLKH